MKWVGIAAALLSFGTAVYGLLHAEGELRERERVVAEQLAAGRVQQAAGDYASAWSSFAQAASTAATDGFYAKLLGRPDGKRREILVAQQDLAMGWVAAAHVADGHKFSEFVDKLLNTLATGAATSSGARKADLLGHLGWAYFLKNRDGEVDLRPDTYYQEAVAIDPTNPYANMFWGHWILWNNGAPSAAMERFTAALASNRARADVRRIELAAFANAHSDDADDDWWRVVADMRKNGEPLDPTTRHALYDKYYFALGYAPDQRRLFKAIPPADHLELLKLLLQSATDGPSDRWMLTAALATTLEAADRRGEALATWRALQTDTRSNPDSIDGKRAGAAVKRLDRKP